VISWLPAMIAKENGIFEKNGLDVTMTKFTQIANLPGTVGRQFDVAATTASDMLYAAASGIKIVAVSGNTIEASSSKSYQVIVKGGSAILSAKDLAGKRIAGPGAGSIMHVSLLEWVAQEGGAPDNIILAEVPFPNMADQLKAGRVDAVEQIEPFIGPMLNAGFRSLGDPLLAVSDPALFTFWMADRDWAQQHKDALERYRVSLQEGVAVIKDNPDMARTVLVKYTGLPAEIVARIPFPIYDFELSPSQLTPWKDLMGKQSPSIGKLDVNSLVVTGQ
jgi:ABC-type nitrate/sulfonate/bicarbonate transport system substrate-binding protein